MVSFFGGSLAKRLGLAMRETNPPFSVDLLATVSGGGLLDHDPQGVRYSNQISLDSVKTSDYVVIWVGTNDFFAHKKNGNHWTDIHLFQNRDQRRQFSQKLNDFLSEFTGKCVWILGLIPRYLNITCCDDHTLDEDTQTRIHAMVKRVNIDISRKAKYFTEINLFKKVVFVNPDVLGETGPVDWMTALSNDSIHLTDEMNNTIAQEMRNIISGELFTQDSVSQPVV